MYHVFEEVALDAIFSTLDTVSDFCEYLQKRELFLRREIEIDAAGEEELLAFYLSSYRSSEKGHDFIVDGGANSVVIGENFWTNWKQSKQCLAKQKADKSSYSWDRLIERFAHHMCAGTLEPLVTPNSDVCDLERSVRWMAREPRCRRRMLANTLLETMDSTVDGQLRRCLIPPVNNGDPYWVFLVLPRRPTQEYKDYREFRQKFLVAHCLVVKYLHSDAQDVVAIAVEPPNEHMTEDIIHYDARRWTEDLSERARKLHLQGRIFVTRTERVNTTWEYPIDLLPDCVPRRKKQRERVIERRKKRKEQQRQRSKNRD